MLNRIRWNEGNQHLAGVRVYYRHRGAPDDTASLDGSQITDVGRTFLDLADGSRLPHHRILRIERSGEVLWTRPVPTKR